MEKDLVSILIPAFNRANLVDDTIKAAVDQTYKNIEVIIVDNSSTDDTWEVLKGWKEKDSRIRIFQNDENIGPVRNWQRCIQEAKGEYSKILFSDDLIENSFVEDTLKAFSPDVAFVISEIRLIGSRNNRSEMSNKSGLYSVNKYLEEVLFYNTIDFPNSPGCAIFRTNDLKESLLIDIPNSLNLDFSKYGAGNDLLLFLITASKYQNIVVINKHLSIFRAHNDSFTVSNSLYTYYDFAKKYFVVNYYPQMLKKLSTVEKFRGMIGVGKDYHLDLLSSQFDLGFLVKYLAKRMKRIVKNSILIKK